MRKFIISVLILMLCGITAYEIQYIRWKHFWSPANRQPYYVIHQTKSDTLRVLMIGDSWAEMHSVFQMDSFLQSKLVYCLNRPVKVFSKGIGGEKSKGIYMSMFENGESGTKPLLSLGCDYCVILAGINDAANNLGTEQFCQNYHLILDFLFKNEIQPVVIEIPDVDIWNVYGGKPKKDLLNDFLRSIMTHCGMYNYSEYREALHTMLQKDNIMHKVIYVPMNCWNGRQALINKSLFLKDGVHLNKLGYEKLDSCIALHISQDFAR